MTHVLGFLDILSATLPNFPEAVILLNLLKIIYYNYYKIRIYCFKLYFS